MRTIGIFLTLGGLLTLGTLAATGAATVALTCTPDYQVTPADNGASYRYEVRQAYNLRVLEWTGIPAMSETFGRYRLSLRAAAEGLAIGKLTLQAAPPSPAVAPSFPSASLPIGPELFPTPGQWQTLTMDFDVELGKPLVIDLICHEWTPVAKGEGIIKIDKASVTVTRLPQPVTIAWARTAKIRYKHTERGALQVHLSNITAKPQRVTLTPIVIDDEDRRLPAKPLSVTIPARQTLAVAAPFPIGKADGGYEVMADLAQGGARLEERSGDVFVVSDSPWQCAINEHTGMTAVGPEAYYLGYNGMKALTQNPQQWVAYQQKIATDVERMRRAYSTAYEFFAWAHEDACWLVEDTDEPYLTGQTTYASSRKLLQHVTGLLQDHGIAPVAYVNACCFGWPAFEFLRQHPAWMDERYCAGAYRTASIEKYQHNETINDVNPALPLAYDQPSLVDGKTFLEYHIDQLLKSSKFYGWEGYRYDAGPLDIDHLPRVRTALAHASPPVAIGNNMAGVGYTLKDAEGRKFWDVYSREGSLMMDEPAGSGFRNVSTDPRYKWADWIDYIRDHAHCTRASGGHYCTISFGASPLAVAMTYAVGGHPYLQGSKSPYGEYERFMVRYGFIFWDLRTQLLDNPERVLDVTTPRPIWWKPFVSQRLLGKGRRQIIVPLINKAVEDTAAGSTLTGPVEQAVVTFTPAAGEKVTAVLLSPEPIATRSILPITNTADGRLQVTVPRFMGWANIVFDCQAR